MGFKPAPRPHDSYIAPRIPGLPSTPSHPEKCSNCGAPWEPKCSHCGVVHEERPTK